MTPQVPVRFENLGGRRVPVVQVHLKQLGRRPRIHEMGLVDTGSALTIVSRDLLLAEGFDLTEAKPLASGIFGIGGHTEARYLEDFIVAFEDREHRLQWVNLPRLFFTDAQLPPLIGRELLTLFNATVHIDFADRHGFLAVG